MRTILIFLAACALALIAGGCGGNNAYSPNLGVPPGPSIRIISPNPNTVVEGGQLQYQAVVANDTGSVDWSVEGGDGNGTISSEGLYQSPDVTGSFTIKAALHDDPSVFATATANVVAPGTGGVGGTIQ